MKRRFDWRAFPGILISLIMITFGILFFIVPIVRSDGFSMRGLIFPLVWIIIILLAGIQTTLRFLGYRGFRDRQEDVLSNLYGPGISRSHGNRSRYVKDEDRDQETADVSEPLYQLELMRLDGAITDEEYEFLKSDLMKKHRR